MNESQPSQIVSFKAEAELIADLQRLADLADRTLSAEIRRALRIYVLEQQRQEVGR